MRSVARLRGVWSTFWGWWTRPPGPVLRQESQLGEILVARIRLGVGLALVVLSAANYLWATNVVILRAVLVLTLVVVVAAIAFHGMAKRQLAPTLLPFLSSSFDVTAVMSFFLVSVLLDDARAGAVVSLPFFFLSLLVTILRNDPRLCLWVGALGLVEIEAAIVWLRHGREQGPPHIFSMSDDPTAIREYAIPAILIVPATILATTVVVRFQQLRWMSIRDPLTRLLNRQYFEDRLMEELHRATRSGKGLALVMLDLDHFKQFNDSYGHAAGDAALRAVSKILTQALRSSDLVARYGGEEFVALLPDSTSRQVQRRLETVRRRVRAASVPVGRERQSETLSISMGVADTAHDGGTAEELLAAADRRLYVAKARGRNRIVGPDTEPAVRPLAAAGDSSG